MENPDPVGTFIDATDRVVLKIGHAAAGAVVTYAANAARRLVQPAGPPAENPPKRQRTDAADNPYKRKYPGGINNRDTKRRRRTQELLGTSRPVMAYGKRRRTTFKRSYNRSRPARRRLPVRSYRRKTYGKKTYRAKKSTVTAARLLATMLR